MHRSSHFVVELRSSRFLFIGGVNGHLFAGVAVVISATPLWIKTGLIASILLSLIRWGFQYSKPYGHRLITRLELLDGRWRLETSDGVIHHAQLRDGYAHPGLVILNFRLDTGQHQSLTLLPDATDAESLRRLRVWLRTRRKAEDRNEPW